jgi:hypothetical protein
MNIIVTLRDSVYSKRMSLTLKPATPRQLKNALKLGLFTAEGLKRLLYITFISGPWLLLTSRLSAKAASLMIMLCVPALLFCGLLTIPGFLFESPEQHAYYQFAKALDQDPTRWIILAVTGLCTLMALAIPATTVRPLTAVRY